MLCKFIKRKQIELMMFGYVNALLFNMPSITIEKALLNFYKFASISEDDMQLNTARMIFVRMRDEFFQMQKTEKTL